MEWYEKDILKMVLTMVLWMALCSVLVMMFLLPTLKTYFSELWTFVIYICVSIVPAIVGSYCIIKKCWDAIVLKCLERGEERIEGT